jgi:hypothetical protein
MNSVDALNSIAITLDGPSKTGKTYLTNHIAIHALSQDGVLTDLSHEFNDGSDEAFRGVFTVSAGNIFRAAAALLVWDKKRNETKTEFNDDDVGRIREFLGNEATRQALQNDPNIEGQVSTVAQMKGVHALCGRLFCDDIAEKYNANGGGNLVIVDARGPVDHMRRNGILGNGEGQIVPASIMPIYIHTPVKIAAKREEEGSYHENLSRIKARRKLDSSRREFPVKRPDNLIDDYGAWLHQFVHPELNGDVAAPFLIKNDSGVDLGTLDVITSVLAAKAREIGRSLQLSKQRLSHTS